MKKKAWVSLVAVVLVLCCAVGGTLAWLTAQSGEVKNTFSPSDINIKLKETTGTEYKMIPGYELKKDPKAWVVAGSEDCYLFVKVDNQITAIEADGNTTVAAQMAAKGWKAVEGKDGIYVYVGTTAAPVAVKANDNVTVFEQLVIAGTVNGDTLKAYENKTITVTAYAVQKDGFEGKTADQIWSTAFGA